MLPVPAVELVLVVLDLPTPETCTRTVVVVAKLRPTAPRTPRMSAATRASPQPANLTAIRRARVAGSLAVPSGPPTDGVAGRARDQADGSSEDGGRDRGAVALVACLGTANAASAPPRRRRRRRAVPAAPYSTIENAVAEANPGDTIVVCPGAYDPTHGLDARSRCAASRRPLRRVDVRRHRRYPADTRPWTRSSTAASRRRRQPDDHRVHDRRRGQRRPRLGRVESVTGMTRNVIEYNGIGVNLNGGSPSTTTTAFVRTSPGSASGTGIYPTRASSTRSSPTTCSATTRRPQSP